MFLQGVHRIPERCSHASHEAFIKVLKWLWVFPALGLFIDHCGYTLQYLDGSIPTTMPMQHFLCAAVSCILGALFHHGYCQLKPKTAQCVEQPSLPDSHKPR